MLRGEIWWGVSPSDPAKKPRPLLIVSNNHRNQAPNIQDVIVIKLTSLERANGSKKPVNPVEDYVVTLKKETIVQCAAVFAVEKKILTSKANQLSREQMKEIDERIKNALDLH
ncbi:MAG: type II toxin-antitoxin system PemK/MazF family toxin [Bdellovibrionales bacterium]|nr:type II toxin-antitoxin system PemK/MazF family toxin [Bdellovibrionales bacterium]